MDDDKALDSEALLRERKLIRAVVDMVPAMLAYWDASQRCVFANRAYETWFGVTPAELIGHTMKELLGPIYPLNLPYIEGALRGEAQQFEREIPDPANGPPRYSQANYVPDIEGSTVRGFFVLVSDITQRKRIEDDLKSAKRLAEEALAQVKTLTGLLPICAWCRKIRDGKGYWESVEQFLTNHTDASFTHGMCEACEANFFSK
ncbi:MAG TPA: PAS domain-containing protein [Polyangia bacterium]|nr:PAS domain-containing protein [Polyangia bacterium]